MPKIRAVPKVKCAAKCFELEEAAAKKNIDMGFDNRGRGQACKRNLADCGRIFESPCKSVG